jgi:hypothetical protein
LPAPRRPTEPLSAERLSDGAVRPLHFRLDVSLLRDGLTIGWQFGARSLEQLVRVAQFLEHCVYEPGTMRRTPDGVAFTLHNPPLRMGAFSGVRLFWDGQPVPATAARVILEGETEGRTLAEVDAARPLAFASGRLTEFRMDVPPPAPGDHRVRLELQSLAVPPLIWFEFHDPVRGGG